MAFENTVSSNFWSAFVDYKERFRCVSGVFIVHLIGTSSSFDSKKSDQTERMLRLI